MKSRPTFHAWKKSSGASLIEVLISVLILSFGMLALGGMIGYAVQLPKLSGNRAVASAIANDMIERMRANISAYTNLNYDSTLTYDGNHTIPSASTGMCSYPNCTTGMLATMDLAVVQRNLRIQLPAGGFSVVNDGGGVGRVYILWNEGSSASTFATESADNCPSSASSYTDPRPRCIMIPFKL